MTSVKTGEIVKGIKGKIKEKKGKVELKIEATLLINLNVGIGFQMWWIDFKMDPKQEAKSKCWIPVWHLASP